MHFHRRQFNLTIHFHRTGFLTLIIVLSHDIIGTFLINRKHDFNISRLRTLHCNSLRCSAVHHPVKVIINPSLCPFNYDFFPGSIVAKVFITPENNGINIRQRQYLDFNGIKFRTSGDINTFHPVESRFLIPFLRLHTRFLISGNNDFGISSFPRLINNILSIFYRIGSSQYFNLNRVVCSANNIILSQFYLISLIDIQSQRIAHQHRTTIVCFHRIDTRTGEFSQLQRRPGSGCNNIGCNVISFAFILFPFHSVYFVLHTNL